MKKGGAHVAKKKDAFAIDDAKIINQHIDWLT